MKEHHIGLNSIFVRALFGFSSSCRRLTSMKTKGKVFITIFGDKPNIKSMDDLNFQLTLRPTVYTDLEIHYQFQLDEEANYLAAFTSSSSSDKKVYLEKYAKFLNEPSINNQTILIDGTIVGSIAKFVIEGDAEITYWIDRKFWGRGIATKALKAFLSIETNRPMYGRVAFDNLGSQKVLENCGFVRVGTDRGFANARQIEIEEFIYRLD
ncbi:GNAT family N-acetyltransferase [Sphingobacterium siyangense]|uniref:RimJ/RimL family protein N-acetyltransferase n=1 Tax=Sphingobacterium siyangense TaxID=459529 RepID=A0A562M886_9SPHI|nr:GNAT family N-acetyltransferase [Sphingobacterium siyangense]TWI16166.1 RimJ/RimL family protein N-acetyltransferase [Sphingobacterium siyangense]